MGVEPRPWPLTGSFGAFFIAIGLVFWFHGKGIICLVLGLVLVVLTMVQWWRDVIRERTFLGFHTIIVERGLRYGIIIFILSEVCFYFSLIEGSRKESIQSLLFTVFLGLYFTFLQAGEYIETSFTVADSVYGSVFFVATGFHGLHVIIGSIFLAVCLYRIFEHQISSGCHFGFEAAAWY